VSEDPSTPAAPATIYMPADVARLVTYHVGGLVMLSIVANGLLTPKVWPQRNGAETPRHTLDRIFLKALKSFFKANNEENMTYDNNIMMIF